MASSYILVPAYNEYGDVSMRLSKSTLVVYGVILILAVGLTVYALKPEMLRSIPFLSEIFPPEDLTVNVKRSSDGKVIIIKGTSTFTHAEVKNIPISITIIPTAGMTMFSSKPKTYDLHWTEYGQVIDPINKKITQGTYGFEMTIQVISVTDFDIKIDVGEHSETFASKSPVI